MKRGLKGKISAGRVRAESTAGRGKDGLKHELVDVKFLWSDNASNLSIQEGKAKSAKCRCYAGITIGCTPHPVIEVYFDGMRHCMKRCAEGITCDLIHELCHWAGLDDEEIPW